MDETCATASEITNYDENARIIYKYLIPGLVTGCLQMDSLFISTFECLYDQTCLNIIQQNFILSVNESRFPLLNSSLNRRNETVIIFIHKIFVK